jgi:hypothetical protein
VKRSPAGGGLERGNAGPTIRPIDQPFFEPLAKHVPQARDLTLSIGDNDCAIAPRPEGTGPMVVPTDLLGDVGQEVLHETSKLRSVVHAD